MSRVVQSHLALFTVNLLYGINFLVAKGLMPQLIGPSGFIVVRVAGAAILFWLLWLIWYREPIRNKRDLGRVSICALFGVAANQLLFFNGLCITSPVNASIIMVSTPILVLLMAAAITKEKITGQKLIGVVMGCTGAITLILGRGDTSSGLSSVAGDLMVFVNAVSYAIYFVLVRPLMEKYRPLTVISYVFLFAIPLVLPFGWTEFTNIRWGIFKTDQLLGVAFVVIGVTFAAYLLNIFALKYVGPSVSSVYIYLQPLVATMMMYLLAYFGLGAPADLTFTKVLCGLLIFTGVFMVSHSTQKVTSQN